MDIIYVHSYLIYLWCFSLKVAIHKPDIFVSFYSQDTKLQAEKDSAPALSSSYDSFYLHHWEKMSLKKSSFLLICNINSAPKGPQ